MGITQLKNYHPVTGTANFLVFLSSFTFPFIINNQFQMLGSLKIQAGFFFFFYRRKNGFPLKQSHYPMFS